MRLDDREIAALCRGLCRLLHGGLSLNEGLFLLAEEAPEDRRELLRAMGQSMDQGHSLHHAMAEQGMFPAYVCGMVDVGEEAGRLEEALEGLADHYDANVRTARRIRAALAYPSMILGLMLVVITVLLTRVLPVFQSVYASLGVSMTGASGVLLALGRGLGKAMPVLLVLLAAAAAVGAALWRSRTLRERAVTGFWRRFGDRGVLRRFGNARFVRALALGLGSGLPVEKALELALELLADIPAGAARCEACAAAFRSGGDLAQALGETGFLTPARSRMLHLGLGSGSGDRVLKDLAESMMEEAEDSLEDAVGRIEPAMVTGCSVLVGAILLTVMLPLVDILSALGG